MAIYGISDLHLSFQVNKKMDVFKGFNNYVERIEQNWKAVVSPDDTVAIPGDTSWAMELSEATLDFKFIHDLPGNKVILKGNHDYWWTSMRKMQNFLDSNGFSSIQILHNNSITADGFALCGTRGWVYDGSDKADQKVIDREAGRLETSLKEGVKTGLPILVLLHYPPIFGTEICNEILDVLLKYNVDNCYYGHIHDKGFSRAVKGYRYGIDFRLISADYLKFTPILLESNTAKFSGTNP